jgi:hypothetical protein
LNCSYPTAAGKVPATTTIHKAWPLDEICRLSA